MATKNRIYQQPEGYFVDLEVYIYQEDEQWVAYCPVLELASSGNDSNDAFDMFNEALQIFIEETHKAGTLEKVLLSLGWRLQQLPEPDYRPPTIDVTNLLINQVQTARISIPA